jgi:glycosyltransferase involved in cell wall biosynthesis
MTSTMTSIDIENQTSKKNDTSSSYTPHPIEVSLQDLETYGFVPLKGLCAVIPAYNEELSIGSVVLRTRQYVERVIVVDDGSSDRTGDIAKLAGAELIQLDKNTGKAYALLLGLKHARKTGCSIAVMLDADGQHDPSEIRRVAGLVKIGKADLVIGSRFLSKNQKIPGYRVIGQKTLDLFTNIGAKTQVTDSQSGFRALSCQALDNLDFKSDGYNVESDMIAHFAKLGLPIMEVPITVNYDIPNKHKMNPVSHGVGVLSKLITLIGYQRPMLLFGILGIIFIIIGFVMGFFAFIENSTLSNFPVAVSILSTMFFSSGILMIISGLLLNTLLIIIKQRH